MAFNIPKLPLKGKEIEDTKTFRYEGRDILTDETLLQRNARFPGADPEEVIGFTHAGLRKQSNCHQRFAALTAPKVRRFFECKAFGKTIELHDPRVIRAMSTNLASYVVIKNLKSPARPGGRTENAGIALRQSLALRHALFRPIKKSWMPPKRCSIIRPAPMSMNARLPDFIRSGGRCRRLC